MVSRSNRWLSAGLAAKCDTPPRKAGQKTNPRGRSRGAGGLFCLGKRVP
jgi:hypothetical protein